MKLNDLSHDAGHPLTRHKFGYLPASYLFVETVVGAGILGEAAETRLNQIMQGAIGRLQNFLTPGASSDLETMLGFFAPKGGGLARVQDMIKKAGDLKISVAQDQVWWQQLFTVFNVLDTSVQQQIQQRAIQAAGNLTQDKNETTAGQKSNPAAQIKRQEVLDQNQELTRMIDKNTAAREASLARMKEIQARIDALAARKGTPTSEGVFNFIAGELLNEADVKSNLRFVASNLMRRLGYTSTTPIQEIDWLKRFACDFKKPVEEGFGDFFRNMRMMATNPGHVAQKAQDSQLKSHNQRVAKLAIQYLSDWLTQEMGQRLRVANLTVQDMMKSTVEWRKLQAQHMKFNGQPVPKPFQQQFDAARERMERIVFAMDPNLVKGDSI